MKLPLCTTRAFTLIEVMIAMAVFAFAIVGLLSLMATALQSSRDAMDDSLVAGMANQVITQLRATPFGKLNGEKLFFFDADGVGCEEKDALYRCNAVISSPAQTTDSFAGDNWKFVELAFLSPPSVANPRRRDINATIPNID